MDATDPIQNQNNKADENQGSSSSPLFNRYTSSPENGQTTNDSPFYKSSSPSLALPKGGGAVKGIDEKFSVNASNGTAALSIELPLSPARNGFTPGLSLSYNSGSGNSEFGLGWSLSLSSIQRKSDKRLPKYQDAIDSDVFLFSEAEDLIPYEFEPGEQPSYPAGYTIKRYRPRIEGLFAKIEYIRKNSNPEDSWWRVISADNITTYFGLTENSRISDPADHSHIFSWLPAMTLDNNGNVQLFEYIAENLQGVLPSSFEQHHLDGTALFTNRYLKTVHYCNKQPFYITDSDNPYTPPIPPLSEDFLMEVIFDYGDQADIYDPTIIQSWTARSDAFSIHRSGFEIRTYRRCRRVLMYHRFDFPGGNGLVRSLDLSYEHDGLPVQALTKADFIVLAIQNSHQYKNGSWRTASLPALTYQYQPIEWNTTVHTVSEENIQGAPQGLTGPYQWMDFEGEGISGIFTEQSGSWYYKNNLGNARFTPAKQVAKKPSFSGISNGTLSLQDLDADGRRQIVAEKPVPGFWELDDNQNWVGFRPFESIPNIDRNNPFCKFLDLNGDGKADILITEDRVWTWFENLGTKGYTTGGQTPVVTDEEKGPVLLLRDTIQSIFLADMTGDGLTDLVRIINGAVCYWPNMGYGKFGAKVTMSNAPVFTYPDLYNPSYLSLADITGSGVADLIYIGQDCTCKAWLNLSGNGWSVPKEITPLPSTDPVSKIAIVDFLGNGTSCLVWSSPLPQHSGAPIRYIDLMGGKKPFLLMSSNNGMGLSRQLQYKSSTYYYTEDKLNGIEWATKIPFPVHCISEVSTYDTVSETLFKQSYWYRHGYYDHEEREYRGFGYTQVTDTDTAIISEASQLDQPPVVTKQWFHTGAWMRELILLDQFRHEYYPIDGWDGFVTIANMPEGLSTEELREAHRALKGLPLRVEVYAADNSSQSSIPYTVVANAYQVKLIQHKLQNRHGCFMSLEEQQLTFTCEREATDARIAHQLTLKTDKYGNVLQQAQVAYRRAQTDTSLPVKVQQEQAKMHITCSINNYTSDVVNNPLYQRLPQLYEAKSFEAFNFGQPTTQFWTVQELLYLISGTPSGVLPVILPATEVDFSNTAPGVRAIRLLSHSRTLFKDNTAAPQPLPLGMLEARAIPHEQYQLAFTPEILEHCYVGRVDNDMLHEGGYKDMDGNGKQWIPSGTVLYTTTEYPSALQQFFTPLVYLDPWNNSTNISFGDAGNNYNYWMLPISATDALNNTITIEQYDWRLLQAVRHKDINDNISEVLYDTIGMPVAMALMAKDDGTEGDTLQGLDPDSGTDLAEQEAFWDDPEAHAHNLIKGATWRCVYDLEHLPLAGAMIVREQHYTDNPESQLLIKFTYIDALNRILMQKVQCEATASNDGKKWIGSGRTVYNNKGNPVMQYEPYFTENHYFDSSEQAAAQGVTALLYYDPLDRNYRTNLPDGTFTKNKWTAWEQLIWDSNDTVLESQWYSVRIGGGMGSEEQQAAIKAAAHANTLTRIHTDTLARGFYTVQMDSQTNYIHSFENLDIQGNRLSLTDGRGLIPLEYKYNMIQVPCRQHSIDSGTQHTLTDIAGQPFYNWDTEERRWDLEYDPLRRPLKKRVKNDVDTKTIEFFVYGEGQPNDKVLNLRGQLYEQYNSGGKSLMPEGYDFKGNPKKSTVTLLENPEITDPDWDTPPTLGQDYSNMVLFDALNRPIATTDPGDNTQEYFYDRGGVLKTVKLNGDTYVQDLHYDAKGQRQAIWYGNGTKTRYTYDDQTFRLRRLLTTKGGTIFQDLHYWYDPIGNITQINDDAQQTLYYANNIINPNQLFTYDALYRLIEAEGREQIGSNSFGPKDNWTDATYKVTLGNDATRKYRQQYRYDEVGNILRLRHIAVGGNYTREYTVDTISNKMLDTQVGSESYSYSYDSRGNIQNMPHLSAMNWNMQNELHRIKQGDNFTYYQYSGGQRIRKYTDKGTLKEERIYLGSFEIYRKYEGSSLSVERQTVHVNDDTGRIAMLEQRTVGTASHDHNTAEILVRYIYSNHLQSASLELDESASIISYEEYHPFGTTSYQAKNAAINAVAKRYRYTGKERDDESGLYYHDARYYIPWLARWVSCDPINSENYNLQKGYGLEKTMERDFIELCASPYEYAYDNPVNYIDETGEQPNTKQKVVAYTNPDISGFETAIKRDEKALSATKQKYIDYYKQIGKITDKSTPEQIEKVFSPANKQELKRLTDSIAINKKLLSEAKAIQKQWNKLDREIENVVDEYNNLKGLKGKDRLDPNLLKALMFSETELGAGLEYKGLIDYVPKNEPKAVYQLNLGRVTDGNVYNAVKKEFKIPVDWETNYKDLGNINDVRLAAGALIQKYEYAKKVGVSSKNNNPWFNAVKAYKGNSNEGERKANKVWNLYTTGTHPYTSNVKLFIKK